MYRRTTRSSEPIDSSVDSSGSLAVILGLASLQALAITLLRLDLRLPDPSPDKPWFRDDVLYQVFSHLDPQDAAQAGLVCKHWHRNAAHASYREVTLLTFSPFSRSLAHTLLHHPDLRLCVRHLTVVHSMMYPQEHLYEWVYLLPPSSLKTCRIFGVPKCTDKLRKAMMAHAARTETVYFGFSYPEELLRAALSVTTHPGLKQAYQNMLNGAWGVMTPNSKRYRDDIEAISPPTIPLPMAIEQFSECVQLDFRSHAHRKVDVYLSDRTRAIERERVDAVIQALYKYVVATCFVGLVISYEAPGTECLVDHDSDVYAKASARPLAVLRGCLCSALPATRVPSDVAGTACVGVAYPGLTGAAVSRMLDRIWTDERSAHAACLYLWHRAGLADLPDACATCGLTGFCMLNDL
ncbi:hypothetical protein TRAPUB_3546 [Trametes pubescens]|uniref:F-box domain-containing protein n=1 Tax=Trametes pubescens TaxID=154538 RepID=A0A1M2VDK7_TRAPU|nr:hypothetical protein TRAPUB_3546 [Trametes pubescens]